MQGTLGCGSGPGGVSFSATALLCDLRPVPSALWASFSLSPKGGDWLRYENSA